MADNVYAQRLRYYRTLARKSQSDVARHLNVSQAYVSGVEAGKRGPMTDARTRAVTRVIDAPAHALIDAKAEVDGYWMLPVCGVPADDRLASFLALVWKDMPTHQKEEIERFLTRDD
jgi:transcriptional regulator with XRE-family HTH domain